MPQVLLGAPNNFGCYVIVDKEKFVNNLFNIDVTYTYSILSKYYIQKMIVSPSNCPVDLPTSTVSAPRFLAARNTMP
jgi:hypothetical protein